MTDNENRREWLEEMASLVALDGTSYSDEWRLMEAIKKEVAILVANEEKQDNWYKRQLNNVSAYYRRRIGYLRKLATTKTSNPQTRLDQIANNCNEILKDNEDSVRFLTSVEE